MKTPGTAYKIATILIPNFTIKDQLKHEFQKPLYRKCGLAANFYQDTQKNVLFCMFFEYTNSNL